MGFPLLGGGGGGGDLGAGIGSAVGNIAILAGAAGKGGKGTLEKIDRLWKKLELSDFDMRALTPEEYRIVAEYFPNVYEAVVPEEVKLALDSPEMRMSQSRGLARLEQIGREGLPLEDRIAAQEAQRAISGAYQRGQSGIIRDLQERGRAGGGTEIAARLSGLGGQAEVARGLGTDLVRESMRRRLEGTIAASQLAGNIRGQDLSREMFNADATNRFNEFRAGLMTQAARDAALARERASFANVGERQRIADINVSERQRLKERNQEYPNYLKNLSFQQAVQQLQGRTGALTNIANAEYAEQAARAAAIRGIGEGAGRATGGAVDAFGGGGQSAPALSPSQPPYYIGMRQGPYRWYGPGYGY